MLLRRALGKATRGGEDACLPLNHHHSLMTDPHKLTIPSEAHSLSTHPS